MHSALQLVVPKIGGNNLTEANPRGTTFGLKNQEFKQIKGLGK